MRAHVPVSPREFLGTVGLVLVGVLLSSAAAAQQSSGIAGQVRDNTGGVLL